MTLLVLPLLAFVAAHESTMGGKGGGQFDGASELKLERRRAVNGTELTLECASASHLVRTHMAPDFEHPQLVRRLDWMHEDALIASFRQEATMEMSQQWWVSNGRFELQRPFFGLKIGPILPQDAGQWKCRLETDALFAAELPQNGDAIDLVVRMRPPTPPKPSIVRHSDNSVTLEWSKFTASPAHQPILRFSVLIAQPDVEDGNGIGPAGQMRVLATADNQTGIEVAGLRPNTRYAFSVRAENAVGESQFGPEILFRTIGLPPKKSPEIHFLRNGTTPDCVDLEWTMPNADNEPSPIVGFRIMVHRVGTGAMREWYVKGARARNQSLCSLEPNADYVLTLEADNGFGYSAGTTAPFRTDQSIPDGPPQLIQCRPLLGGNSLTLNWRPPLVPNGPIRAFFIYFKDVPSQKSFAQIRLDVGPGQSSTAAFAFNLTKLLANTRYKIRISAATDKGEGPKSEPILVDTDFEAPKMAPNVSTLSFGCDSNLLSLEWNCPPELLPEGADGLFQISVHSSMANGTNPRVFNISTASPHKLLLDQINLGERLSLSISLLIRSRSDPAIFLPGPPSALAHFALISNGWRCRFRSSVCPPTSALPPSSFCEHFPDEAAASIIFGQQQQSNSAAIGHGAKVIPDANMSFIFLIFGASITLAISLLFGCILRRRCLLLKSFLRGKQQQKGRRANGKWRENGGQTQESTSLVKKAQAECSVILPPITVGRDEVNGTIPSATGGDGANNASNACCCELGQFEGGGSQIVNVLEFEAHFSEMTANGNAGFERQFKEIERETTAILLEEDEEEEDGEENNNGQEGVGGEKMKDRYLDIGALPKRSRIRLAEKGGGSGAYINANFVDSCDQRRAYIATQAPLPHTFSDFWAMVWQEKCQILVALTNMVECGRRKCDQYWPDRVGAQSQFGHYLVRLTGERSNSVFTHRMLELRRKMATASHIGMDQQECRVLHQLHFMAWPDHGVPDSPFPLLHFINYAADLQCSSTTTSPQSANPIIVHCSAGVGRSGAFILIDSLRRHLLRCDRIDVCGQLRRMRRQRVQLVQNLEQFVFCHQVIRHLVANGISRQPRSHFSNYCRFLFTKFTPNGLLRIQAQFQDLLCCQHGPGGCASSLPIRPIPLPGYHRVDEFLICPGQSIDWFAIWEAKCQSLTILDSRNPSISAMEGEILNQLLPSTQICIEGGIWIEWNGTNRIQMRAQQRNGHGMKKNGKEEEEQILQLTVHRMCTADLLANPWTEIEKLQLELQNQHRSKQALFEFCSPCRSRPSAAPFIFCALQSAACQLEQEAAVDVLLWLASYKHAFCGCWTDLAEIELIYQKVLELVEIQRALC